jgi:hypothetical protein
MDRTHQLDIRLREQKEDPGTHRRADRLIERYGCRSPYDPSIPQGFGEDKGLADLLPVKMIPPRVGA